MPSSVFWRGNERQFHTRGGHMAKVQLSNVSKKWGSFVGVDRFDLTIADKEFLVLLKK